MNSDAHNDSNNSFTKLRENFVDVTSYLLIVKFSSTQYYYSNGDNYYDIYTSTNILHVTITMVCINKDTQKTTP